MVNHILAFLNMSLTWVFGVAKKQDLNSDVKLPCYVQDLSDAEQDCEYGNIVPGQIYHGGCNTQNPSDGKAYDIANDSCLVGAFAVFGNIVFHLCVLVFLFFLEKGKCLVIAFRRLVAHSILIR